MKVLRTVLISLGTVFFAVVCGALLLFNWHSGGWQTLDVPTGSMRPTIAPGSLVLVHRVPSSTIKVGDVITFINPQKMKSTLTHRVIAVSSIGGRVPVYKTKGDANPSADPWTVVGGLVRGKAVWHIAKLGSVLNWSKTWFGLAVLLYLPALLLMIEEVQRLSDYLRVMQPYKLPGRIAEASSDVWRKWATSGMVAFGLVMVSAGFALPVHALLKSNTVSLVNNRISVAAVHHNCGSSNNNVNISNSNNQTASSGNTSNSDNTNGSSATSGSTSNSNNTNINITINNC